VKVQIMVAESGKQSAAARVHEFLAAGPAWEAIADLGDDVTSYPDVEEFWSAQVGIAQQNPGHGLGIPSSRSTS
jgi:hypothetical protein